MNDIKEMQFRKRKVALVWRVGIYMAIVMETYGKNECVMFLIHSQCHGAKIRNISFFKKEIVIIERNLT